MSGSVPANDGASSPASDPQASEAVPLLQQALDVLDAAKAPAEIAAYVQTALDALKEHISSK